MTRCLNKKSGFSMLTAIMAMVIMSSIAYLLMYNAEVFQKSARINTKRIELNMLKGRLPYIIDCTKHTCSPSNLDVELQDRNGDPIGGSNHEFELGANGLGTFGVSLSATCQAVPLDIARSGYIYKIDYRIRDKDSSTGWGSKLSLYESDENPEICSDGSGVAFVAKQCIDSSYPLKIRDNACCRQVEVASSSSSISGNSNYCNAGAGEKSMMVGYACEFPGGDSIRAFNSTPRYQMAVPANVLGYSSHNSIECAESPLIGSNSTQAKLFVNCCVEN